MREKYIMNKYINNIACNINNAVNIIMSQYPLQIFTESNYRGFSANLGYGKYKDNKDIGFIDNSVVSLKIAPFTMVFLFENTDFTGKNIVLVGPKEIPWLGGYGDGYMNKRASSYAVIYQEPNVDFQLKCCKGEESAYKCGEFTPGSGKCANSMSNYCSADKLNEPLCQSWCKQNPTLCDPRAIEFCNANPTDPFCTCLKSPAAIKGVINPRCVDRKCLDTGYMTSGMQQTQCPSMVDCSVQAVLNNSGVILSNTIPVQQNCGMPTPVQTVPTNPVPVTPQPTTPTDQSQQPITLFSFLTTELIIVIVLAFILFIAIIVSTIVVVTW